jgi:hypothetical protein
VVVGVADIIPHLGAFTAEFTNIGHGVLLPNIIIYKKLFGKTRGKG